MSSPLLTASVEVEVPFHDVDVMQVAWHGHYLKYFEVARCELLRALGYDYPQMRDSGFLWPVVDCRVKYVRPARYGQVLRVTAELVEFENRMKIVYVVRDAAGGETLTKGFTVQVAVCATTGELQFVAPAALVDRVKKLAAA